MTEEVNSASSILHVDNITAGYGAVDVLFDVSVEINKGEFIVVIGPNGAGKTTLMRTIGGVIEPNKGDVIFKGQSIVGKAPSEILGKGISYVPQEDNIFAHMSIQDNLEMGAYTYKGDVEERYRRVFDLFPILQERLDQEAGSLSGGQRQMLAISRGIMMDPDFLILDEPTSGLQPSLVTEVLESIVELKQKEQLTILMVAQTEQAIPKADRGYLLRSGEVVVEDSTDTLLDSDEIMSLYFGG